MPDRRLHMTELVEEDVDGRELGGWEEGPEVGKVGE